MDQAMDPTYDKLTTEKIPETESKAVSDWNQRPQESIAKDVSDYLTGNAQI